MGNAHFIGRVGARHRARSVSMSCSRLLAPTHLEALKRRPSTERTTW
jgi:hypothetical protein